jgi:hypothetical protein
MLPAKANLNRGWATAVPSPTQGFAPGRECTRAALLFRSLYNYGHQPKWRNWQTRYVQGVVRLPSSGFKSRLRHLRWQDDGNMYHALSPRRLRPSSPWNRLLIWLSVAAITLSLPLIFNVAARLQAEARMATEVARMTQQVQDAELRLARLRAALDYARSDAFVERWARVHARWSKVGEVVVVPPVTEQEPRVWWEDFLYP